MGAKRRRRLVKAPFGDWNTSTFVAAPRPDLTGAPWPLDGPRNGGRFRVDVEQRPTAMAGDLVIMDSLGCRRGPAVRHAFRQAGAKRFPLPSY